MRKFVSIVLLQFIWLVAPAQERQWFSEADIAGLNFPGDARNNAVSFVIDDVAYVGMGDDGGSTNDFWSFNPATNTWIKIADFPGTKRSGAVAFTLGEYGYVGLGKSDSGSSAVRYNDFYRYDPATNEWSTITPFGGTGRNNAIAFTIDGKAYVGTGEDAHRAYTDDIWEYDPISDTWSNKSSLPNYPRSEAIAFSINGRGYIGCGIRSGFNFANNMYEYNPSDNTFRRVNDFFIPYSRTNGVAFVLQDKAYIGLGFEKTDFVIYDPANNDNLEPASIGTDEIEDQFGPSGDDSRWGAVAFVVQGKAFVGLGGVRNGTTTNNDIWSFQYPVPDAPEELTVTDLTLTEVSLRWNDLSDNEQGFVIERSVGDGVSFSPLASLSADATTYQDNTLGSNQVYYYRVQAVGQSDNSSFTNVVSVNTYSAPDGLIATMQSDTTVMLNWQDNSAIETGFVIERSPDGTTYAIVDTLEADLTSYTDAQTMAGIDYRYRVYALVSDITTDATSAIVTGILTHPANLSVITANPGSIQLSWNYTGTNASHYVIERKIDDADFTQLVSITTEGGKQYNDANVEEGQQYVYRIKTTEDTRTSGYSASVQTTTALLPPRTVTATVEDSTVIIRWKDVSERETNYIVRRSFADGSGIVVVDTLAANTISYLDTTPLDSGDYRYIIHAVGVATSSTGAGSNTITIIPKAKTTEEEEESEEEQPGEEEETVTGIDDETITDIVKAYPNPSNGPVSVYVGSERFAYVAVFNSQGRLVSEVQQAEQGSTAVVSVDLQYFSEGIYTLRIYTARGVVVKKIAKQ